MISLKRHALTIVAIFLALVIGLALGVTAVATGVRDALVSSNETTQGQLESATRDAERARNENARLEQLAEAATPVLADGVLDQQPVLIVQAPGAADETVSALAAAVRDAGALDAGRITLTEGSVDPERDTELKTLVENLPLGDARVPPEDDLGTLLGLALGRAGLIDPSDEEPYLSDEDRGTVMTTLADSEFISYERGTLRPATLVLVVAGPDADGDRIAGLSRSLDGASAGVVTTSTRGATGDGDAVSTLRGLGDTGVTTVDNAQASSGTLAVVLGLAEQLDDAEGAYGFGADASAALPSPAGG